MDERQRTRSPVPLCPKRESWLQSAREMPTGWPCESLCSLWFLGVEICSFSVAAPSLTPAEPRFGLNLERNGASFRAGLTCYLLVGLGEIRSKEKHYFFSL